MTGTYDFIEASEDATPYDFIDSTASDKPTEPTDPRRCFECGHEFGLLVKPCPECDSEKTHFVLEGTTMLSDGFGEALSGTEAAEKFNRVSPQEGEPVGTKPDDAAESATEGSPSKGKAPEECDSFIEWLVEGFRDLYHRLR